mmetsp:Transcript_68972/g.194515  ORF Transcript_68972/g.194515 Transcript_68972/m.194515 type:complete len:299 (-) Transcript_68972:65-961(-)
MREALHDLYVVEDRRVGGGCGRSRGNIPRNMHPDIESSDLLDLLIVSHEPFQSLPLRAIDVQLHEGGERRAPPQRRRQRLVRVAVLGGVRCCVPARVVEASLLHLVARAVAALRRARVRPGVVPTQVGRRLDAAVEELHVHGELVAHDLRPDVRLRDAERERQERAGTRGREPLLDVPRHGVLVLGIHAAGWVLGHRVRAPRVIVDGHESLAPLHGVLRAQRPHEAPPPGRAPLLPTEEHRRALPVLAFRGPRLGSMVRELENMVGSDDEWLLPCGEGQRLSHEGDGQCEHLVRDVPH